MGSLKALDILPVGQRETDLIEAAEQAWQRTLEFFGQRLKS